jgi:protoporphyrinogen/coproporphyrinogen III oxidase
MTAPESRPRVAVVGGGISGMTVALALLDTAAKRGAPPPEVVVLEEERCPGGKIRTHHDETGFTCEHGVNGFLNKEPLTTELVRRLGLEEKLLPASPAFNNRFIYTRGKLRRVSMNPVGFVFSGLMPLSAKLRLARELFVPPRPEGDESDESVADFARRRVGDAGLDLLVDPMQTGIYAGDPERMSVKSCFPRVVEVERRYGGLLKGMVRIARERRADARAAGRDPSTAAMPTGAPTGHLTSFSGGMQVLIDRLAEELGSRLRLGAAVRGISLDRSGARPAWRVQIQGDPEALVVDAVVLACPAHASARLAAELDERLARPLGEIPYPPMAVVCLGFTRKSVRHPMDGFGFLAPRSAGLRILGALFTSSIFPERVPGGRALVRAMIGGARDTGALDLDDDTLTRLVLEEVTRVLGVEAEPVFTRVFRHPWAIPQYVVGHAERLLAVEARLRDWPGLSLAGNSYHGIGVNDCARNAWPAAELVLSGLAKAERLA